MHPAGIEQHGRRGAASAAKPSAESSKALSMRDDMIFLPYTGEAGS